MKKAVIDIEGMNCASCAMNIERSIKKLKGVKSANVNLLIEKGFVEADESVTESDIRTAVKRAGYRPENIKFEEEQNNQEKISEMPGMTSEEHMKMKGMNYEHMHSAPVEDKEIKDL